MRRPPRRRRAPALLRARYRTLFFLALTVAALALGQRAAAVPAAIGALAGFASIRVSLTRGSDLAHSFVVADWLLLGVALALSGGADSWLLGAVPLLAMGQLAGAARGEWPYLVGPALALVIVLAIADPSLGGSRAGGLAKIGVLVAGGSVAATRLQRRPARGAKHTAKVDASTGLWTAVRLEDHLERSMATALAEHLPLSVVCVRLEHYRDSRDFLGARRSEELVRAVAKRAERRLCADGRAFRTGPDSLVLVLPGCPLAEARETASLLAHDVGASLIAGRRQTLATGVSSFPTVRRLEDLLATARQEASHTAGDAPPERTPLPLAAAQ